MTPNYSLSTTECYENFATNLASRGNQDLFAVMQCAGAFPQDYVEPGFMPPINKKWERSPSWVPDWTKPRRFRPLFCSNNSLRAGYVSSTQQTGQGIVGGERAMRLDGLLLGRIKYMSHNWLDEGIDDKYMIHHVLSWWLMLLESGLIDEPKYSGQPEYTTEAFASTITPGHIDLQFEPVFNSRMGSVPSLPPVSKVISRTVFKALLKTWLRRAELLYGENDIMVTLTTHSSLDITQQYGLIMTKCYAEDDLLPEARHEVRRTHQIMKGRTFFVTDSGHMGICSRWASKGDLVGIPFGASTPFVFRSRAELNPGQLEQHVHLVSDCYVEGVMEGQAGRHPKLTRCTFVVE